VPAGIEIQVSGDGIRIHNEFFDQATNLCAVGLCTTDMPRGGTGNVSGSEIKVDSDYQSGYTITQSTYLLPSGWTASFSPSNGYLSGQNGNPSKEYVSNFTLKLSIPSSTACDEYYPVGLNTSAASVGEFTTLLFDVCVTGVGCGGGGCVAYGTPILTPAGYVAVQDLSAGDSVSEYNVNGEQIVTGSLLWSNTSTALTVLSINEGELVVTVTDQPIYIRNSTFEGWVRNPSDLTLEDSILDPVNETWVVVTSLATVHHRTTVYDVVTSGEDDFVANGLLLDVK
jgi:hypothetical protein